MLFICVIVFLRWLVILVFIVLGDVLGNFVVMVIWGVFILGSLCILRLFNVVNLVIVISRFSIIIRIGCWIDSDGKLLIDEDRFGLFILRFFG